MTFSELDSIDWDTFETTADWIKLLNDLLGLTDIVEPAKQAQLADKLDEFADHSTSEDLATITKLDGSARKAARALRDKDVTRRIQALSAASTDFQTAVKDFSVATTTLKKEAAVLRLEKINVAATSLTSTISSLKNLALAIDSQDDKRLTDAINQTIKSAQSLREILEKTS